MMSVQSGQKALFSRTSSPSMSMSFGIGEPSASFNSSAQHPPQHPNPVAPVSAKGARQSAAPRPSQAWSILCRHARDDILPIHLQQLCSDKDRVSSLVSVHSSTYNKDNKKRIVIVDISRQRMTLDTMNHLLRLAVSRDLKGYIRRFSWGQNNPENPITKEQIQKNKGNNKNRNTNSVDQDSPLSFNPDGAQSMHMALRAPREDNAMAMFTADGTNALPAIHDEWARIELLANTIRAAKMRGVSGQPLRDVVVVGRGVSVLGLKFVYSALLQNQEAIEASRKGIIEEFIAASWTKRAAAAAISNNLETCRRMRFVACADPSLVQKAVEGLNPSSTIIITVALRENEDTDFATRYMTGWLCRELKGYKKEHIVSHHMFLVTGDQMLKQFKPESTFLIPDHSRCEAFGSFTAATLLPLSIVFGWHTVEQFLAGAHDMDKHFVETNPRHNLPVLLALTDVWNDAFLGSSGRIVTPFSEQFASYASFVAALESETCGRCFDIQGRKISGSKTASAVVIQGNVQGEYDRMLYQGGRIFPSELVAAMHSPASMTVDVGGTGGSRVTAHDRMMCTLFAHADLLAFGSAGPAGVAFGNNNSASKYYQTGMIAPTNSSATILNVPTGLQSQSEGNRPSTLIICSQCDAFTCGQLVSLSEHRVIVAARLWDVNPFLSESGSRLRESETERLQEKLQNFWVMGFDVDDDEKMDYLGEKVNFATSKVLAHYANSRS